jgi:serine/threonine protein kinase/tetratricopeptide (TPR) repeat protein
MGAIVPRWHNEAAVMGRADGTDPAMVGTPVPLEGDGHELIGMIIDGRYRLDATLGRGGMGLVYRAAHVGLRRQVAVKILHPSLAASPEVRNRFEREALAVGKIDHPNCVTVFDVGRLPDGALYLAMELLEGRALADVLEQEGQIAPGRALHILGGVLRGLAHIHAAKLIHRDIKPENIFLIRQGQDEDFAKILDFGIAKPMAASDLDDGVKLTQAGMAFGTPIYMAPEQALGNPMDGRADLYAAAVIAFEMLCGQPPFYSDDKLEVMAMHTARPVPPMRQRLIKGGRSVPSSIERLVVRGLTKKPSDRYATAEDFLAEVERALRTPDGGVTDVVIERRSDTGSQPLVVAGGEVRITGETDFAAGGAATMVDAHASIAEAIDDALTAPARSPGLPGMPLRGDARGPVDFDLSDGEGPDEHDRTDGPELPTRRKLPEVPDTESDAELARIAEEIIEGAGPGAAATASTTPRGGIGLGLPYTGPHGVPVFGLTPEQRLAGATTPPAVSALEPVRPASEVPQLRRRFGLYVVIATCAIAIGVAGAVITANLSRSSAASLDPGTPAGAAAAALAQGDPGRALQILEANHAAIEGDANAQLVLGHVRASRNENQLALAAYDRALQLDPALEADDRLRAALRTMAGSTQDYEVVARAFGLWVGKTDDGEARKALLVSAVHDDLARRKAVRRVIDRSQLGDRVDWLRVYSLDLQQEPACELRREAVAKLRALGDVRAVTALERALVATSRTPSYRGRKVNECLAEDASAAIGYLRGLSRK